MIADNGSIASGGGVSGSFSCCGASSPWPGFSLMAPLPVCLHPVRVHVDLLLDLHRQRLTRDGQLAQQQPAEDVELLQVGVRKREDLREEGVQPDVVDQVPCGTAPAPPWPRPGNGPRPAPGPRAACPGCLSGRNRPPRSGSRPPACRSRTLPAGSPGRRAGWGRCLRSGWCGRSRAGTPSWISSASLAKSSTMVSSLPGWMRLSRERVCTACTPRQLLVHVHRVQQRLVEAGLELLGDDQEAVLVPLEGLGGLGSRGSRSCPASV